MKYRYLIGGLVVVWMAAYAAAVKAEIWVMPNTANGEITLTGQQCKAENGTYPTLKHAYTWTNQIYVEGCWTLVDGNVHVVWLLSGGLKERRVYKPSDFTKKGSM